MYISKLQQKTTLIYYCFRKKGINFYKIFKLKIINIKHYTTTHYIDKYVKLIFIKIHLLYIISKKSKKIINLNNFLKKKLLKIFNIS